MVGGVLFVTLRDSLSTTKTTLAVADRDTTALLQDLGRIALLTDEYGNVQSFIEKLDQHSRIKFVAVIDLSGRIMASTDPAQVGTRPYGRLLTRAAAAHDLTEIANGTYRLGWIKVLYSNDGLVQAHRQAYRLGLALAVAGMMLIALVGWTIGHLLTRQLSRLAAVADEVSAGDLTPRARLHGWDEVARVGRAFDAMVDRLEERLETIRLDRDRLILPTEAITEGFVLWNPDERLVRYNTRFRNLLGPAGDRIRLGISFEEFLVGAFDEAVSDNGQDRTQRIATMLELHRRGSSFTEFGLRDGRWVRVSKSRLPDGSVIGIYTDITETKAREFELQESEQQLRAIMDSVGEGIMVLDSAARVQVVNPTAAAVFGYDAADLTGRHVDELLVSADEPPSAPAPGIGPRWSASVAMVGGSRPRSRWACCAAPAASASPPFGT